MSSITGWTTKPGVLRAEDLPAEASENDLRWVGPPLPDVFQMVVRGETPPECGHYVYRRGHWLKLAVEESDA